MRKNPCINTVINAVVKLVYHLLYHQFAFTYDLAAWIVSFGHWKEWTRTTLPFIRGTRILELGCGPGHLLVTMAQRGLNCYGIDESTQMCIRTYKKIQQYNGYAQYPAVFRGFSQYLPFADNSFTSIISTFPSNYIFDPQTLSEISRVLTPEGNLIIVPTAVLKKNRLEMWIIARIFNMSLKGFDWQSLLISPLRRYKFLPQVNWVDLPSSQVMVINAVNQKSTSLSPDL